MYPRGGLDGPGERDVHHFNGIPIAFPADTPFTEIQAAAEEIADQQQATVQIRRRVREGSILIEEIAPECPACSSDGKDPALPCICEPTAAP